MSKPRLGIIIASVRTTRIGGTIGEWVTEQAREFGEFDVDVIDLAEVGLPLTTNEPNHPASGDYVNESTKAWSARIAACNAFIIVSPEYNHGYPASLKNALDLVYKEWGHKPVGLATYGGISGGLRSAEQIKQVVSYLSMPVVTSAFMAPFAWEQITDGTFEGNEAQVKGTKAMLSEILDYTKALLPLQGK